LYQQTTPSQYALLPSIWVYAYAGKEVVAVGWAYTILFPQNKMTASQDILLTTDTTCEL